MKVIPFGTTRVFNRPPLTIDGEFDRVNSAVPFALPELVAEAGVAHWFSRGWRRSARDLNDFIDPDFIDPVVSDFKK